MSNFVLSIEITSQSQLFYLFVLVIPGMNLTSMIKCFAG